MAEPVALGVSVVGLASLFDTCMEGFECMQLGKTFGEDYGKCLLKLDISQLRLARWAETIGLTGTTGQQSFRCLCSKEKYDMVEALLEQISYQFEETQRGSERYQKTAQVKSPALQVLAVSDPDVDLDRNSKALRLSLRERITVRQKGLSPAKKAGWTLFEKRKFDHLVEDINNQISELIDLFPTEKKQHGAFCQDDVRAIKNDQVLLQTLDAVADEDELLKEALQHERTYWGHTFGEVVAREGATVHAGDVNFGGNGASHVFHKVVGHAKARLHAGNVNYASGFQMPQQGPSQLMDLHWQLMGQRFGQNVN